MGGKKKSQRRLSWRDWKPHEDVRLREIIDSGGDYAAVAEALGRSEVGVVLHAKRVGLLMTKTKAQLTATGSKRLLGLSDQKIIGRWITAYRWLEGTRAGKDNRIWRVSWEALLTFLQDRRTWMAWQPHTITDSALREWAVDLRQDEGRWLRPGEVGKLKGVGPYTPASWIAKGLFTIGDEVVKYGNWWFWSVAVEQFVPPLSRVTSRGGANLHGIGDWAALHYHGKTEWVEVGRIVEERGKVVILRRGRLTAKVPPFMGRREGLPPAAWLPPGRHPKRGTQ